MSSTPSLSVTWQRPTFLLPLFGLCPLLGASDSLAVAIGLSVIVTLTALLAAAANTLLYALTHWCAARHAESLNGATSAVTTVPASLSQLLQATAISITITTMMALLTHAWAYALYVQLGLYLPMTITVALLLGHPAMQSTSPVEALRKAMHMSGGFTLAALVLGTGRELVGHGSLFADASTLLGSWAQPLTLTVFRVELSFLLGVLAPGAFVALGLGIALYNWLAIYRSRRIAAPSDSSSASS